MARFVLWVLQFVEEMMGEVWTWAQQEGYVQAGSAYQGPNGAIGGTQMQNDGS